MQTRKRTYESNETPTTIFSSRMRRRPDSEPIVPSEPMAQVPLKRTKTEEDYDKYRSSFSPDKQSILDEYKKANIIEENVKAKGIDSNSDVLDTITENIKYSSYFFRKDIVDNFERNVMSKVPNDKKVSYPLSKYKLYNADDILENIGQRGTFKTRFSEKSQQFQKIRKDNTLKLIQYLSEKVCQNIGSEYAQRAVDRAISPTARENEFDIIVLSSKNIEALALEDEDSDNEDSDSDSDNEDASETIGGSNDDEEYIDKSGKSFNEILDYRLSGVVGFIIVELGECKAYPKAYSINLICTNNNAISGSGSILMGLYLYTILSHPNINNMNTKKITFPTGNATRNIIQKPSVSDEEPIIETIFTSAEPLIPVQHYGVLELASGYINAVGLCMYEKFGFQYTERMYGAQCFEDFNNLPMLIDFDKNPGYTGLSIPEKQQKIINITAGIDKGLPKSKICSVRDFYIDSTGKKVITKEQILLGYLKTLKIFMEKNPSDIVDHDDPAITKLYYTIKYINEPKSRTPYESRPEPSKPGKIDDYINYLETPEANRKTKMDLTPLIPIVPAVKTGGTKKIRRIRKSNKTRKMRKIRKTKTQRNKKYSKKTNKNHK